MDIFVYNTLEMAKKNGFNVSDKEIGYLPNISVKGILIYNPFYLTKTQYEGLVLPLHFAHITTWILLFTKRIHKKKLVLWGQGISVKRYLKEEKQPDWKLKLMINMADGVLFYTEKEKKMWNDRFPNKMMVALNNTLSGVKSIVDYKFPGLKDELKRKYGIKEEIIFIFCARFESIYRRIDLLLNTIHRLDSDKFGFIIIGNGKNKPDFSLYPNVYDYGAVYDTEKKHELFTMADAYYQPSWMGLSIVEAMAYGKAVLTFQRSEETKQGVEYAYIKSGENGLLFSDMEDCITQIERLSIEEMSRLGSNAREFVKKFLTIDKMVNNALMVINSL